MAVTLPLNPAAAVNYFGFAPQAQKGTGVAATYFAAYMEAVELTHNEAVRRIREAGAGPYIARDVKDVYVPGFRFATPARPLITTAILALFLGADAKTGAADPYTHTLTPADTVSWLSAERNISDEVTERIVDAFFTEVQIDIRKRDSGPEAMLIVTGGGLSPGVVSPSTDTYETGRPWLRSDATWKLDGAAVTNVERATLTLRWLYDESILADAITRSDLAKLGFEADLEVVQVVDDDAQIDAYLATHYGTAAGTAASETVYQPSATDSFEVKLDYDETGPLERSVTINIPKIAWTDARLTEPTPNASEAVRLTRTGHLINAATPITAICINSGAVDLV